MRVLKAFSRKDDTEPVTKPAAANARDRLRLALAARGPAQAVIDEAIAARGRVRDLIAAAQEADEIAAAAEANVATATQAWALQGASENGPEIPQTQLDAMATAQRVAGELHFKARGAKAALPALAEKETDARVALRQQDEQIRIAVTAVLLEMHESKFTALEQMHEQYLELIGDCSALAVLLDVRFGHHKHVIERTNAVRDRLAPLAVTVPDERDADTKHRADELARFARQLLENPEAKI